MMHGPINIRLFSNVRNRVRSNTDSWKNLIVSYLKQRIRDFYFSLPWIEAQDVLYITVYPCIFCDSENRPFILLSTAFGCLSK